MPKIKIAWTEIASYETVLEADDEDDAYGKLAALDLNDPSVEIGQFNRFLDESQILDDRDPALEG